MVLSSILITVLQNFSKLGFSGNRGPTLQEKSGEEERKRGKECMRNHQVMWVKRTFLQINNQKVYTDNKVKVKHTS